MSMQEFFNMGGYAFYVWSSYGLTLLVLAANIIAPFSCDRRTRKMLRQRLRRRQAKS